MKCDQCGREIKVGGTYFLTQDGKKFCERHCYGQVGLHRPVLPIVNIEPKPTYIPVNQCDGCWRVLPINKDGMHFDPDDNNRVYIYCQAHNYEKENA